MLDTGGDKENSIVQGQDALDSSDVGSVVRAGNNSDSGPTADVGARVDAMAQWAQQTKAEIRGLTAGAQVMQNTMTALATRIDVLAEAVANAASEAVKTTTEPDQVIGYQPSVEQQSQLFAALAEWQVGAKPLEKGNVANIQTRGGSTVSYRYADIASVSEIARSAGSAGLAHFHCEVNRGNQVYIRTYLVHKAGGWISCDVPLLVRENSMVSSLQVWASACTMARRYGLFMVLGIAAGEEDDDGAQSAGRGPTPVSQRTKSSNYGNRSTSLTPDS